MRVASTPGWAKTYSGFLGTKSWLGRASLQTGNAPARTVYFRLRSIVNHLVGKIARAFCMALGMVARYSEYLNLHSRGPWRCFAAEPSTHPATMI